MSNNKYEITDISHEKYPFLHRVRALRDVGAEVKAGDLGGFVESESNLSATPGDNAWIYEDAIAAGDAYVDQNANLRQFQSGGCGLHLRRRSSGWGKMLRQQYGSPLAGYAQCSRPFR